MQHIYTCTHQCKYKTKQTNIMQKHSKNIVTPPTLKLDIVLNVQKIKKLKE